MARKIYKPEEIVNLLRQVEVSVANGKNTPQACKEAHTRFLHFISSRMSDTATAENILHSAYIKALEQRNQLRADENVIAWFYRILRNSRVIARSAAWLWRRVRTSPFSMSRKLLSMRAERD